MNMKHLFVVATVATVALAGCSSAASQDKPSATPIPSPTKRYLTDTRIGKAADASGCTSLRHVQDQGQSITFDTQGEDETADDGPHATITEIACVLGQLNAPSYVIEHIDSTSSLDGQQTDEWDGFEARFKYHPDNGLDLTIIDTQFKKVG